MVTASNTFTTINPKTEFGFGGEKTDATHKSVRLSSRLHFLLESI